MSRSPRTAEGAVASDWSPDQIDVVCDAFEEAYRRGEQPRIGDYVDQCAGPQRKSLFAELMLVDVELRKQDGQECSYQQYVESFPEFGEVVETIAFKQGLSTSARSHSQDFVVEGRTRIAHFQLEVKLGSGGMGEVWRAWDSRLKRTVAIKVPRGKELNEEGLHRFLREGRAAAQLKHPFIVPVHEVGREGDVAYIVSEFIAGGSLEKWLADRIIKPHRAAELCAQLADALHHAHERGIIHRDLKPLNVLLSADGNPHVVDFGIAKWAEDTCQLTLDGYAVGTPAYMSPEQARGNSAHVDRRADVYALGAILYRMLTGKVPFQGETPTVVLRAVIDDNPRPPRSISRDIPRDLETICLKAMEKEPARRYATAEDMGADLARFMKGDPILGRRPSLLAKTARTIRRRPAAAAAIALALFGMTAVGFAAMVMRENRSLQGLLPVTLETNPPGARVAFVPLDETTQEPRPKEAVYPTGRTPLTAELKPGDYLVVAALDDGRFHEVFRRVPKNPSDMSISRNNQKWTAKGEGVALPKINIPESSVTRGMALVEPEGESNSRQTIPGTRPLAYYIDVREVTYRDCRASRLNDLLDSAEIKRCAVRPDHALTVNFDRACTIAEDLGKRLPTAAEFEWVAAQPRAQACVPGTLVESDFGPAGSPECDRVGNKTPIAGLYSNVAEWTTTVSQHLSSVEHADKLSLPILANFRMVKGGDMTVIEGNPTLAPEHRDPAKGLGIERYRMKPGIGFRCVRSASPRFLPKE